jgi:hypothetical protein
MNFEKASRLQLRFDTTKGLITVEDLWDLKLTSRNGFDLDTVAKSLSKAVKESGEESFVQKRTAKNAVLELKFDIVKHIIKVKMDEADVAEKAAENKTKKATILSIINTKQNEELQGKSVDELTKMAESL